MKRRRLIDGGGPVSGPAWANAVGLELDVRTQNAKGFTLIEILTVVVILGIAAAAVIPELGTRDDLKIASTARNVMGDLMYAQNRAIATQKKHYVQFSGSTYTL